MLCGGGWGLLFPALFCRWRHCALQDYELATPLSIESAPEGRATIGRQNGLWDVHRGEAVLIWLNEVFCKEETHSLLIDSSSCKTSHDRIY